MTRRVALLGLFVTIFLVDAPECALASPFDFGFSSSITVVANVDVLIPAVIINHGVTAIDFDSATHILAVQAAPGEGLNALNLEFVRVSEQFGGLILEPNERFDFIFGKINFDPSNSIGNPLGTILHPTFSFRVDTEEAGLASTISIGAETTLSPLTFVPSTGPLMSVPETGGALLYSLWGFVATGPIAWWRRRRLPVSRTVTRCPTMLPLFFDRSRTRRAGSTLARSQRPPLPPPLAFGLSRPRTVASSAPASSRPGPSRSAL